MDISLAFDFYRHESRPISSQRCINLYAESQPRSAKSKAALLAAPGIASWAEVGDGPIRGLRNMGGLLYVVSKDSLWTVAEDGTKTFKGSGIGGTGQVSMDENGFELIIVNSEFIFSYLLSTDTMIQVASAGAMPAKTVTNINNIFVYDWLDTNQYFISNVLDGRTYDLLNYASAESNSDNVLAVRNRQGVLYLLGEKTIELVSHTGASSFPFSAVTGGVLDRGIVSSYAISQEDSALFILGDDIVFYRVVGQSYTRISTSALEAEWASFSVKSDAFCLKYPFDGHKFIVLTFPTGNRTYIFDIATNLWHERQSYDYTNAEQKWRVTSACEVYGSTVMGDGLSNRIGMADKTIFTEFGVPIIASMVTPPVFDHGKDIAINCLELDMETGVGINVGQGSDPKVIMSYSKDGGRTFEAEQEASIGAIGQYLTRVRFPQLGSAYEWTFKFQISDPVRRTLIGLRIPDYFAS